MSISTRPNDFSQARAILRDAAFKVTCDPKKRETIQLLKLLKAREENIDFEIELAERICGDNSKFPYRSSQFLTKIFSDLGFQYTHDKTTRKYWVKDVLLELDAVQISRLIQNGLFRKKDYKNPNLRIEGNKELSANDFLEGAIHNFQDFINQSVKANQAVDLDQILGFNLNMELFFNSKTATKDKQLNRLIDEAKERFLNPDDKNIALEKLWDAFERIKTYYNVDKNKKKSASKLINQVSIDLDRNIFDEEFRILTTIGNEYQIRHHEVDKKPITETNQINYLFFRMLSLIDLCLDVLRRSNNDSEI